MNVMLQAVENTDLNICTGRIEKEEDEVLCIRLKRSVRIIVIAFIEGKFYKRVTKMESLSIIVTHMHRTDSKREQCCDNRWTACELY